MRGFFLMFFNLLKLMSVSKWHTSPWYWIEQRKYVSSFVNGVPENTFRY